MSTTTEPKSRRYSLAEIDALLAAEPQTDPQSCVDLQAGLDDDMDALQNLQELPPKSRAGFRTTLLKDMKAIRAQMKAQGCDS